MSTDELRLFNVLLIGAAMMMTIAGQGSPVAALRAIEVDLMRMDWSAGVALEACGGCDPAAAMAGP
jgi:hypothetical protein